MDKYEWAPVVLVMAAHIWGLGIGYVCGRISAIQRRTKALHGEIDALLKRRDKS